MTQELKREVDLSEFHTLRGPGRHTCGEACHEARVRRFPSAANLHWERAFRQDPEMLGEILRDILKAEKREPGRHGPRPGLDSVLDAPALDRLRSLDPTRHAYSRLRFPAAFTLLLAGRSVRSAARKLTLSPARVQRLKAGSTAPTLAEMELIADRYERHPGYFLEYRVWSIQAYVEHALGPEESITFYERLWRRAAALVTPCP